jgi:hypothetical protein
MSKIWINPNADNTNQSKICPNCGQENDMHYLQGNDVFILSHEQEFQPGFYLRQAFICFPEAFIHLL